MKRIQRLFPDITSTIFGAAFIVIGIYLILLTAHINAGIGSIFIGIFTIMVMTGGTVDEDVSISAMRSDVDTMDELLDDLGITGDMVQVPPGEVLSEGKTYVPVDEFQELPDIQDDMVIVSSAGGRIGIALTPPGHHLMKLAEKNLETPVDGIEGAREVMGILTHGLGLAKSYSLREEDGNVKVRITHGTYQDHCNSLRENNEAVCTRTGCPLCSAYLTTAAQYLNTPLKLVEFSKEGEHITYEMEEIG
ncbi:MAG: hypothetical protein R6U17_06695 [Thermoplasmata archaeon]